MITVHFTDAREPVELDAGYWDADEDGNLDVIERTGTVTFPAGEWAKAYIAGEGSP